MYAQAAAPPGTRSRYDGSATAGAPLAPVAQWTEQRTSNPKAGGSNPPGGASTLCGPHGHPSRRPEHRSDESADRHGSRRLQSLIGRSMIRVQIRGMEADRAVDQDVPRERPARLNREERTLGQSRPGLAGRHPPAVPGGAGRHPPQPAGVDAETASGEPRQTTRIGPRDTGPDVCPPAEPDEHGWVSDRWLPGTVRSPSLPSRQLPIGHTMPVYSTRRTVGAATAEECAS